MSTSYAEKRTYASEEGTRQKYVLWAVRRQVADATGKGGAVPRGSRRSVGNNGNDHLQMGGGIASTANFRLATNCHSLESKGSDADARSLKKEFSKKITKLVNIPIDNIYQFGKIVPVIHNRGTKSPYRSPAFSCPVPYQFCPITSILKRIISLAGISICLPSVGGMFLTPA